MCAGALPHPSTYRDALPFPRPYKHMKMKTEHTKDKIREEHKGKQSKNKTQPREGGKVDLLV